MSDQALVDFRVRLGERPSHNPLNRAKIEVRDVNFWYGPKQALHDITLDIHNCEVTAFIGPSGCGKTTLLRSLNRSNDPDIVPGARLTGTIILDGADIRTPHIDPPLLRKRFGWVAQKPDPFPWSIYSNIVYGARLHGMLATRSEGDELVEHCLRRVGMWDEVKDRLDEPGTSLSGGQQQRLCIARAIGYQPEVLLMDEPASALDPHATALLEKLIDELSRSFTIVIITHNMQQAARVAQRVAMFHLGRLVEVGDADAIFVNPRHSATRAYITGRFG